MRVSDRIHTHTHTHWCSGYLQYITNGTLPSAVVILRAQDEECLLCQVWLNSYTQTSVAKVWFSPVQQPFVQNCKLNIDCHRENGVNKRLLDRKSTRLN